MEGIAPEAGPVDAPQDAPGAGLDLASEKAADTREPGDANQDAGTGAEATPDATTDAANDAGPMIACSSQALSSPAIKGPSAMMTDSDQSFRSLTIDPTNPSVVFLGSEGNGMFRTTDSGQTWTWLRAGLRYDQFAAYAETWSLAIPASDPQRIYAAMTDSPGPVTGTYPSSRGGVYRSDDRGDTWRQVGCTLPNAKVASVWVDPANADTVIAGLEGGAPSFSPAPPLSYYPGGLWKSTDGGNQWTQLTLPPGHDHSSYWTIVRRAGQMWTFGIDGREMPDVGIGFLTSSDGVTYSRPMTTFATQAVTGWDVSADGMTILANVRDTFKLHRSTNAGNTFSEVSIMPNTIAPNGVVGISPSDDKIVLFVGHDQLYRSEDGLVSVAHVLDAGGVVEKIEFAPSDSQIVYISVRGLRVFRSGDAGKTWTAAGNLRQSLLDAN